MEQLINDQLRRLAEKLNLTAPDEAPEPYILTPQEETKLIENAIKRAKEHYAWKMGAILKTEQWIEEKLAEINWEERIDRSAILQQGNTMKHQGIWQIEQRNKEAADAVALQLELKRTWNARRVYQFMAWISKHDYQKDLVVNDYNKQFITALCFFISRDERFETEMRYSFKKGLLIRGASGLGKTHLVKCIANNGFNPILILSMQDIADEVRVHGDFQIDLNGRKIIYLDDVGTEEHSVKHFGTTINFFKNFVERVYLRTQSFNHLMISTNNNFNELEDKYGFRVRSRMKDMFNIIDVTGKDMRG